MKRKFFSFSCDENGGECIGRGKVRPVAAGLLKCFRCERLVEAVCLCGEPVPEARLLKAQKTCSDACGKIYHELKACSDPAMESDRRFEADNDRRGRGDELGRKLVGMARYMREQS